MDFSGIKFLVVGSGFVGSTIAERIANKKKEKVIVLEKRNHFGGNSYSEFDSETGIEFHKYGSHIFHTHHENVWDYINKFCSFNNYHHKVLARHKGKTYIMPINLSTINSFYNIDIKPTEAEKFLKNEITKENIKAPKNLEEKAISLIGRPLYETFIKGYTMKQWETDPKDLPASIISRLPVRYSYDFSYFDDPWQGIPLEGYGNIFKRMLDSNNIELKLNTDFFDLIDQIPKNCKIIYTGPIDKFFKYKFGVLGWRTLRFDKEILPINDFQGTTVMNYVESEKPMMRIHEFKHFHKERTYKKGKTLIFTEYSKTATQTDDPYYPINTQADKEMLKKYETEAKRLNNIIFAGRLGIYKYFDMDDAIFHALNIFNNKIK